MLKTIVKRSGEIEDFSANKTNGWMVHVGRDLLDRMDWSSIVLDARQTAPDQMGSQDWQLHLIEKLKIRGSQDDGWPYLEMGGRLYTIYLMKKIHGDNYPHFKDFTKFLIGKGLIRDMGYSDEELDYLQDYVIDHQRNLKMAWFQVEQYNTRYSIRDRVTDETYETPQLTIMRMAMSVYENVAEGVRLPLIKNLYDDLKDDILNPPSPNYNSLGTSHFGMASCCLIAATDDAQSIKIAGMIGYDMTLASGGLGIHLSVRGPGDPVDGGRVEHGGRLNYIRKILGDTVANKQGPRGGAVTFYDTCYSPELELNVMMQNPRTPTEVRERRLNVNYQTNPLFSRKAALDEQYFTFTIFSAPDLHEAFFKADQSEFERLYAKYEADPTFKKDYRSAKQALGLIMGQEVEQSTLFSSNPPEMNRHTSFKDLIIQSNLCVAPETEVLTDQGYFPIKNLEGLDVRVWNGEEFSETTVVKTSDDSELIKVRLNNGLEIDCTPYHKFYVRTGYHAAGVKEVRAGELRPGMALIKFNLPVICGYRELDKAYVNGFYSGDGCRVKNDQRVYLYGDKRKLRPIFEEAGAGSWTVQDKQDREYTHFKDLKDKYFVPLGDYSVDSRLEWFAGLCDSDGTIARNGDNQSLQITSTNQEFLRQIVLMLQTLGVNSRISHSRDEGERQLPDGQGGAALYNCQATERLLVSSTELQRLMEIGLCFNRLSVKEHTPNRESTHFVRVTDVIETGRRSETYCFTEYKRHMGMFNGILTGQCAEVVVPTKAWMNVLDLYDPAGLPSKGETGMCNIGSIPIHNLPFNPRNPKIGYERYKRAVRSMMEIIDYAIDNSEYHYPAIRTQARSRRNCSVGMSGVATLFAKLNLKTNTPEGRRVWHILNERHMYACIEVALEMGIEKGNAPWMNGPNNDGVHGTKWVDGWLPIDTYKRTIDDVVDSTLIWDWEDLRGRVVANKGIRFSSLVAHMPGEQATRKGTGSNSVLLLQALSVDLGDAKAALPWAALDNDLIGSQYQLAWEQTDEDVGIWYGICQKFTDQAISADWYEDRRGNLPIDIKRLIKRHLIRVKYGHKTSYYMRSLTDQGGDQKEITLVDLPQEIPTVVGTDAMSAIDRIAAMARTMDTGEGLSCTMDGSCGA